MWNTMSKVDTGTNSANLFPANRRQQKKRPVSTASPFAVFQAQLRKHFLFFNACSNESAFPDFKRRRGRKKQQWERERGRWRLYTKVEETLRWNWPWECKSKSCRSPSASEFEFEFETSNSDWHRHQNILFVMKTKGNLMHQYCNQAKHHSVLENQSSWQHSKMRSSRCLWDAMLSLRPGPAFPFRASQEVVTRN